MKNSFRTIYQTLLIAFFLLISYSSNAQEPARLALVIGNDTYSEFAALQTPANDAKQVAEQLAKLGFSIEGGQAQINLNRKQMLETLEKFYINARIQRGIVLLYYGGHGVAIDGANYLLPIDTPKTSSGRIEDEGIALDRIMRRIRDSGAQFGMLVVDACRTNPFPNSNTRGTQDGLLPVSPPRGIAVLYSAEAARPAFDSIASLGANTGKMSPFAQVFTAALANNSGRELSLLVQQIREDVEKLAARGGKQQYPAFYNEMGGSFYFKRHPQSSPSIRTSADNAIATQPRAEELSAIRSIVKNIQPITDVNSASDFLKAATAAYDAKRYQDAADLFERLSASSPSWYYPLRWYALSICALRKPDGLDVVQRAASFVRGDVDVLRCLSYYEKTNHNNAEALATEQRILASSDRNEGAYRQIVVGPSTNWSIKAQWKVGIGFKENSLSLNFTNGWVAGENLARWGRIEVGIYNRSSEWKKLHRSPCTTSIPKFEIPNNIPTIFAPTKIGNFTCEISLIDNANLDDADVVVSFLDKDGRSCHMFSQPQL